MGTRPTKTALVLALGALTLGTLGACGSDDDANASDPAGGTDDPPTETVDRPDGPAASLSELAGGNGPFIGASSPADVSSAGFVEEEFSASGTATSYVAEGELPADGTYELTTGPTADYATRILVRRPAEAADFNGTVVVEWLNVSGGVDAGPDYTYMADEILRGGYAWVGVSAQTVGVEGGPVLVSAGDAADGLAGVGLKGIDPARYGALSHPGDAFAFDIYTQVGRALRAGDGLGDLEAERVLAVGESQSAFALTTYYDGVQPLTVAFDGFLIHSRGGAAAPLVGPDQSIDLASAIGGQPTLLRTDLDAPAIIVQSETDLVGIIGYHPARQDDSDTIRLWEIAGTAHADAYQVGDTVSALGCGTVNAGPQHFVIKAALRSLDTWVRDGSAPPEAPRLEVDDSSGTAVIVRDGDGIALGGIRTPQVDAPSAVLAGDPPPNSEIICMLFGTTTPMTAEQLAAHYDSVEAYETAYEDAADEVIEAGFVLDDDRDELMADAAPDTVAAAVGG